MRFNHTSFVSAESVKFSWRTIMDGVEDLIGDKMKDGSNYSSAKKFEKIMNILLPSRKRARSNGGARRAKANRQAPDAKKDENAEDGEETGPSKKPRETKQGETSEESKKVEQDRGESSSANEQTALASFFESMRQTTSELPELLQLRIQRKIFRLVTDTKEKLLETESGSGSNSSSSDSDSLPSDNSDSPLNPRRRRRRRSSECGDNPDCKACSKERADPSERHV